MSLRKFSRASFAFAAAQMGMMQGLLALPGAEAQMGMMQGQSQVDCQAVARCKFEADVRPRLTAVDQILYGPQQNQTPEMVQQVLGELLNL